MSRQQIKAEWQAHPLFKCLCLEVAYVTSTLILLILLGCEGGWEIVTGWIPASKQPLHFMTVETGILADSSCLSHIV